MNKQIETSPWEASTRSLQQQQQRKVVIPHDNDVLCGRGKWLQHHPGNIRLRALIDEAIPDYVAATSRTAKSHIIHHIYQQCQTAGGRFVYMDKASGIAFETTEEASKNKIGHTIRYRLKQKRERQNEISDIDGDDRPKKQKTSKQPSVDSRSDITGLPSFGSKNSRSNHHGGRDEAVYEVVCLFTEQELENVLGKPGQLQLPELSNNVNLDDLDWQCAHIINQAHQK